MVKPKDDLNLSLQPQSLTIDAGQDCSPVTPINRSFSNVDTNSFVTAILSPSSHDVFAARARARSRSDAAPPLSSTAALNAASRAVHYSPSLDSINIARPCDTICEGDTSPIKPEGDSQAAPSKPLYDSPSFARRSRLLSSAGGSLVDCFAPLSLQDIGEGEVAPDDSNKEVALSTNMLPSRPRGSTLSFPDTSPFYPTLADFNLLNGEATPSATANSSTRTRTPSHFNRSRINKDEAYSSLFQLHGVAQFEKGTRTSSSNNEVIIPPLSTQSSHGSLDTRYDSSFESSFAVSDISLTLSNSFSESFDISNDTIGNETSWRSLQHPAESKGKSHDDETDQNMHKVEENHTGASSNVSTASQSTLNIIIGKDYPGRRKSHTISGSASPECMALRVQHQDQQDVFGPTTKLENAGQAKDTNQQVVSVSPAPHQLWTSKSSNQLSIKRDNKPRRLTMGGGMPPTVKNTPRAALYQPHKHTSPLGLARTNNKGRAPVLTMGDPISSEQSVTAFQELINAMRSERPVKSMAIEEVTSAEPESIGAVLEYRRHSPTGQRPEEGGSECQLCGSVAGRLTMLVPCGHLACAVCCSSGLNQVTATPRRPHLCAACHTPVETITLRKGSPGNGDYSTPLQTPRGPRNRVQTPTPDEQRLLYRVPDSSSPVKVFTNSGPIAKGDQRRHGAVQGSTPYRKLAHKTSSSDHLTEDQPFYHIQRALQQQHVTPNRQLSTYKPVSTASPRNREAVIQMREQGGPLHNTTAQGTSIVRVDNIPWTVTYQDIVEWLPQPAGSILPDIDVSPAAIHIPVDVFSGKTSNCCFIECKNKEEAMRLVRHRNNHRLMGRPVCLMITTLEDLLNEIFPARMESPSLKDHECIFFAAIHLRQLVELLKRGGAQLKGPLKIIDMTASMIQLAPANMNPILSDMLFHRAREIACICVAACQESPSIHPSMNRLILACSICTCFPACQRMEILDSAKGTLTAVTQVAQIAAPFPVVSVATPSSSNFGRYVTSSTGGSQPEATWQRSRLSSEAALLQHQANLTFQSKAAKQANGWPYSPPYVDKRAAPTSVLLPPFAATSYHSTSTTMTNYSSPTRQRSSHHSSSPVSARHREAAFQYMIANGINPDGNVEKFADVVNKIASACAAKKVIP